MPDQPQNDMLLAPRPSGLSATPVRENFASPIVVAFGGGADGTAMLIELHRRGMRPDLIQFADTGNRDAEKPETYAHVDRMDAWCRERWGLSITWVRNDGMHGTLEADCLAHKRLPSIVYGFKSCSEKYKLRPQLKFLKSWQPALKCWSTCSVCGEIGDHREFRFGHEFVGSRVTRLVGFNADEWHRVKTFDDPRFTVRYPLVEWGITRRMVREICLAGIGYVPLKSACKFCPSSKKSEVIWLSKNHPEQFAECVAMERNADYTSMAKQIECPECDGSGCSVCGQRGYFDVPGNTVVGLGRHWSWEQIVTADEMQAKMFPEAPDMPCMCFDGGAL